MPLVNVSVSVPQTSSTEVSTSPVAAAALDASESLITALNSQLTSLESRTDSASVRAAIAIAGEAIIQALTAAQEDALASAADAIKATPGARELAHTAVALSVVSAVIAAAAASGAFNGATSAASSGLALAAARLEQVPGFSAGGAFFAEESLTLASSVRVLGPATGALTEERRAEILRRIQDIVARLKAKATTPTSAPTIGVVPFSRATAVMDRFIAALRLRFRTVDPALLASLGDLRNAVAKLG